MAQATISRQKYERDLAQQKAHSKKLERENQKLKDQLFAVLAMFKSGRSERRPQDDPAQPGLFDGKGELPAVEPIVADPSSTKSAKSKRTKKRVGAPQGAVNLPDHLERREQTIEPDLDDNFEWELIGTQRTEILEREPGQLYVRVIVRPKYKKVVPASDGENVDIVIAPAPARPLSGSYVGASLLAGLIVDKLVDHLPFFRQIKRIKRESGVNLPKSTVNDWFAGACALLKPLYDHLEQVTLATDVLQADESRIEVLTTINKDKHGDPKIPKKKGKPQAVKIRRGWMWVVHDPLTGNVVFSFEPGRGKAEANLLLGDYEGYLQVDGYVGYADLLEKKNVTYVACAAHIRRKFHAALDSDRAGATKGMDFFARMYGIEKATEGMSAEERRAYRVEHLQPVFKTYKAWLIDEHRKATPKSKMGKAITYALNRHEGLEAVLKDGRLKLDNNLIENLIRPLALGRKNYLFAGSDAGAQRLAMMYSLLGSCQTRGINPLKWLTRVLEVLPGAMMKDLEGLLPGNLNLK